MAACTREQLISTLTDGWGRYPAAFHALSPQEQAAFLEKQGYKRFADLLAHVTAWWTDGMQVIKEILASPSYNGREYDVDAFNASAVEKYSSMDEDGVTQVFEKTRAAMLNLIQSLPDEAFSNEWVLRRLEIEVIGHLKEHEIA